METSPEPPPFGSPDLRLPDSLRGPLHEHLDHLKNRYFARQWGNPVGPGKRPALLVIDLALFWTRPDDQVGCNVDSIVETTKGLLDEARGAGVPVIFTTLHHDPEMPPSPSAAKLFPLGRDVDPGLFEIDPRLERRDGEYVLHKSYASSFKDTNLHTMLTGLSVDTLIVTGVSTSHCVYATCRDAKDSFRVIVPREAVGERCELLHEVFLFDIATDLGDVVPSGDVAAYLRSLEGEG